LSFLIVRIPHWRYI